MCNSYPKEVKDFFAFLTLFQVCTSPDGLLRDLGEHLYLSCKGKKPVAKREAAIKLRICFNGVRVALINMALFTRRPICPPCSLRSTYVVQGSGAPPQPVLPCCASTHELHLCKMCNMFHDMFCFITNFNQTSKKPEG